MVLFIITFKVILMQLLKRYFFKMWHHSLAWLPPPLSHFVFILLYALPLGWWHTFWIALCHYGHLICINQLLFWSPQHECSSYKNISIDVFLLLASIVGNQELHPQRCSQFEYSTNPSASNKIFEKSYFKEILRRTDYLHSHV